MKCPFCRKDSLNLVGMEMTTGYYFEGKLEYRCRTCQTHITHVSDDNRNFVFLVRQAKRKEKDGILCNTKIRG
jgi:hypothetical protein